MDGADSEPGGGMDAAWRSGPPVGSVGPRPYPTPHCWTRLA